jgi:hypothetical protein
MNQPAPRASFASRAVVATIPATALPAAAGGATLSAEALYAAKALSRQPISQVVVSGFARLTEFGLVTVSGYAVDLL